MSDFSQDDKIVQVGKYKIQVIKDLCIGAASCVAFSPETFVLDEEKKAVILEESADVPDNILMAAQSCPTKAIIIEDTETGEQVWPS
ncbi:ferredoxin [Patescibacteria group bacterium]